MHTAPAPAAPALSESRHFSGVQHPPTALRVLACPTPLQANNVVVRTFGEPRMVRACARGAWKTTRGVGEREYSSSHQGLCGGGAGAQIATVSSSTHTRRSTTRACPLLLWLYLRRKSCTTTWTWCSCWTLPTWRRGRRWRVRRQEGGAHVCVHVLQGSELARRSARTARAHHPMTPHAP